MSYKGSDIRGYIEYPAADDRQVYSEGVWTIV